MHYSVWQQICDTYFVHVKKKNIRIFLYSYILLKKEYIRSELELRSFVGKTKFIFNLSKKHQLFISYYS